MGSFQALKGPQGTLFGQPSNAGAFVFTAKKPTEEFEGFVSAGYGARGHHEFDAVLNMPLIDDKLFLRIGGRELHDGGYIFDEYQGKWLSDTNVATVRAQLLWRPFDNVENNLLIQYNTQHNNGDPPVMSTIDPNGASAFFGTRRCIPAAPTVCVGPLLSGFTAYANRRAQLDGYTIPGIKNNRAGSGAGSTSYYIMDTLQVELGEDLTFKNIFGYIHTRANRGNGTATLGIDSDASFVGINPPARATAGPYAGQFPPIDPTPKGMNFYEEAQLMGKLFDGRLEYLLGTSHQYGYTKGPFPTTFTQDSLGNTIINGRLPGDPTYNGPLLRTHGYFGNVNYEIIDSLRLSAGYRYSTDYRISDSTYRLDPTTLQPIPSTPTAPNPPTPVLPSRSKGSTYTFSLSYQVNSDAMVFATYSHGFYPEVINNQAALPTGLVKVPKETPDTVEVGFKATYDIGDVKVRTNLSAFHYWYPNIQLSAPIAYNRTDTGAPAVAGIIFAIPDVKIKGLDGEFAIIPTENFELNGSFQYIDESMPRTFTRADGAVQNVSGELLAAPDWKVNTGFTYHLPFIDPKNGLVSFSGNYNWQNVSVLTPLPPPASTGKHFRGDAMPAFGTVDLTLRWKDLLGHEGLEGTFTVTNVTKTYNSAGSLPVCNIPIVIPTLVAFGYPAAGLPNGICGVVPQEPRTWTARLRYEF
jgi:iron complex outermembrane recepter protein